MGTDREITTDLFLGGKLKIRQPLKGYRSGSDAVLLSAFLQSTIKGDVLDVGCGTGVTSLAVAYRLRETHVTGIDIDEDSVRLATENAILNNLETRCEFTVQDIRESRFSKKSFDHVLSNPPYFDASSPSPLLTKKRAKARSFPIGQWVSFCLSLIKPRGSANFIYPTKEIFSLVYALQPHGIVSLFPFWPKQGRESKRILVSLLKGNQVGTKIYPGLVLHQESGPYTQEASQVLRDGKGLSFVY